MVVLSAAQRPLPHSREEQSSPARPPTGAHRPPRPALLSFSVLPLLCASLLIAPLSNTRALRLPPTRADAAAAVGALTDSTHESEEAVAAAGAAAAVARTRDSLADLSDLAEAAEVDKERLSNRARELQGAVRETEGQAERAQHAVSWTQRSLQRAKDRLAKSLKKAEQVAEQVVAAESSTLENSFADWRFAALHDSSRDAEEAGFVAAEPFAKAATKIEARIGEFERGAEIAAHEAFSLRSRAAGVGTVAKHRATDDKKAASVALAGELQEQATAAEQRAEHLAREASKLEALQVSYEQAADFAAAQAAERIDPSVVVPDSSFQGPLPPTGDDLVLPDVAPEEKSLVLPV